MKFYEPELLWYELKRRGFRGTIEEAIKNCARNIAITRQGEAVSALDMLSMEYLWMHQRKPYYKVWPSLGHALSTVRLDVPCSLVIVSEKCIAIRFSETDKQFGSLRTLLITRAKHSVLRCDCLAISYGKISQTAKDDNDCGAMIEIPLNGESIEEGLEKTWNIPFGFAHDISVHNLSNIDYLAARVALSVMLMARDTGYISPEVLADDRLAFMASTNEQDKQRLIDKAKRRGVIGWNVGEQYEVIPHWRRPHPALVWTEKGRQVPKIVFRKGAVVHRQKAIAVPTGYLHEDGTEEEMAACQYETAVLQ
jgi:hypothetical protein